jgi:hypothetical protein
MLNIFFLPLIRDKTKEIKALAEEYSISEDTIKEIAVAVRIPVIVKDSKDNEMNIARWSI